MATRRQIKIEINIEYKTAQKSLRDLSSGFDDLKKTITGGFIAGGAFTLLKKGFRIIKGLFQGLIDLTEEVGGAIYGFSQDSIRAFNEWEKSTVGLASIVEKKLGKDAIPEATKTAQKLAADGLLPLADASAGLKNLIATGFDLDQATELMYGFKDAAAFGRQGSLDMGQAVVSATEGIKNQNSILVDNVGITKNLSVIMKEQNLSLEDFMNITDDANVRQKIFNGLMGEAAIFQGDAAKASETLQGKQTVLGTSMENLKVTIGGALAPVLARLLEHIIPLVNIIGEWAAENMPPIISSLGEFAGEIADAVGPEVKELFKVIKNDLIPTIQEIIDPTDENKRGFEEWGLIIKDSLIKILDSLLHIGSKVILWISDHPDEIRNMINAFVTLIHIISKVVGWFKDLFDIMMDVADKAIDVKDFVGGIGSNIAVKGVRGLQNLGLFGNGGVAGYQEGRVVNTGSTSGDRTLIGVNKGEMILNASQQSKLFNMIESGGGGGVNINVDNYYGDEQGLRNLAEKLKSEFERLNFAMG